MSPEFQHFRDTWIRVCLHGSRTRTTTAVISLCASLIVSVYYIYSVQVRSSNGVPSVIQPVSVDTPKVVQEGLGNPAVIADTQRAQMVPPPVTPAQIHKLFVEPMGNHLDEALRAEISKQFKNHIRIVIERQDADATLRGLSGARDGRNDPSGFHDNATGSLSLYDKSGKTILWSGAADDRGGEFVGTEHGGEARVAQRLVKGLRGYLKTE